MPNLPSTHKATFDKMIEDAFASFSADEEKEVKMVVDAFDFIPNPKDQYSETYETARSLMGYYFRKSNFPEAKKWLEIMLPADKERPDSGEREFWQGKFAFEENQMEQAKAFFGVANIKSEGRCWENENIKYFKLFKSKK